MDVEEMTAHGWRFRLANEQLEITSEQDPNVHVELNAEAAFSLLDYLYQYRNALADVTESNQREPLDIGDYDQGRENEFDIAESNRREPSQQ
jgi:hypothetical protein